MVNEKRLIDANELKCRIIAFATGCQSEVLTVDSIIMMLNQSDTVDAVEVVHGRWEKYKISKIFTHSCSICNCDVNDKTPYCPYCGAKMDLKVGDEK